MSDAHDEPVEAKPTPIRRLTEKRADHDRVELLAAVLLGIAGALTAFSAYKAALTDGDALKGYTESARSTSEANGFYDDYAQTYNADKQLFLNYVLTANQDPELALGLRELFFDDNLEAATVAWETLPEETQPRTALEVDEYSQPSYDDYETFNEAAEIQFTDAAAADEAGDKFEQASVFLAISLFLAGIASLFRTQGVRYAALLGSALFIIPGSMAMLAGHHALG